MNKRLDFDMLLTLYIDDFIAKCFVKRQRAKSASLLHDK